MHAPTVHFPFDGLFHVAQLGEGTKIQILAIDERLEQCQQPRTCRLIARNHSRLDECVTFPFAPKRRVIKFGGIETQCQRPFITVRPQTHIHTEDKPVPRDFIQRTDHPLAQFDKKLAVGNGFGAVGFAFFLKQ